MKNERIYGKIYDIAAENMRGAGQELTYRRATFLADVGTEPEVIRVGRLLELENEDFAQAAYVKVMQRLPDERTADFWAARYDLPRDEFREQMLRSLAGSSVVAINHISLIDNPYFAQSKGLRYRLMGVLYGLTDKSGFRTFGKKLPMPIQRLIRKVFL